MTHIEVAPNGRMKLVSDSKSGHRHHKDEKGHKDGNKQKISDLKEKLEAQLDDRDRILRQFEEFKGDRALLIEDLQLQIEEANHNSVEWRNELRSCLEENEDLQERLDSRTSDLASKVRALQLQNVELQKLKAENETLKQANNELKEENDELKEVNDELTDANEGLKDEDAVLRNTITNLVTEKRDLRSELVRAKENEVKIIMEKRKLEKEKDTLTALLRDQERNLILEKEARRDDLRRAEESRREASRREEARQADLRKAEEARRQDDIRKAEEARRDALRRDDVRREDLRRAEEARLEALRREDTQRQGRYDDRRPPPDYGYGHRRY